MTSDNVLSFFEGVTWLDYGIKIPVYINFTSRPHLLVVGNTGSGKTHFLKFLLAKFVKVNPDLEIYVCDYKGDDFSFLEGEERYFVYTKYLDGITQFYNRFLLRLEKQEKQLNRCVLLLDEFNTFITSLDKKSQEHVKQMLSAILNMARSKNMSVITGVQHANVTILSSRDAYTNVLGLSTLSKETVGMIFNDFRDRIISLPCGQGFFYADGEKDIHQVIVPRIRSLDIVHRMILIGVRHRNI